jgi:hypothetical protein
MVSPDEAALRDSLGVNKAGHKNTPRARLAFFARRTALWHFLKYNSQDVHREA